MILNLFIFLVCNTFCIKQLTLALHLKRQFNIKLIGTNETVTIKLIHTTPLDWICSKLNAKAFFIEKNTRKTWLN